MNESPFALTPDPRFLFLSHRHREALVHLLFGMDDKGGFVLLTGEVGTGKTTLCRSLLEQVRLLTNLETTTQKLLQILLIGQPELQSMIAKQEMRQLAQRITGRYHLAPLSSDETAAYIEHRLEVAGTGRPLFNRRTLRAIHRLSGGVPRLINTICDRALLGAYAKKKTMVTLRLAQAAAVEVMGKKAGSYALKYFRGLWRYWF